MRVVEEDVRRVAGHPHIESRPGLRVRVKQVPERLVAEASRFKFRNRCDLDLEVSGELGRIQAVAMGKPERGANLGRQSVRLRLESGSQRARVSPSSSIG
jgi:hypothetical protein